MVVKERSKKRNKLKEEINKSLKQKAANQEKTKTEGKKQ